MTYFNKPHIRRVYGGLWECRDYRCWMPPSPNVAYGVTIKEAYQKWFAPYGGMHDTQGTGTS